MFRKITICIFLLDLPRTNNQAEGNNNAINKMMGFEHPVIWTFIRQMLLHQNLAKSKIAKSMSGAEPPASGMKKVDAEKNRRISEAVKQYAKNLNDEDDENLPEENADDSDSDDDDVPATPPHADPSQLERIENNPEWKLLNLIALNERLE